MVQVRSFVIAHAFFLFLLACLGCGERKPTVRALLVAEVGPGEQNLRDMTRNFLAEYPQAVVHAEFVSRAQAGDVVAGRKASEYDVIAVEGTWLPDLVAFGVVRDLTDSLAEKLRQDLWPGLLSAMSCEGRVYAMPWVYDARCLLANRPLCAELGVKEFPATWDELFAQAEIIRTRETGMVPLAVAWDGDDLLTDYLACLAALEGGASDSLDTPAGLNALVLMRRAVAEHVVQTGALEADAGEAQAIFVRGEAVYALGWSSDYWEMQRELGGAVGIAAPPGGAGASLTRSLGLAITRDSPHPEWAWRYVRYLTGRPVQTNFADIAPPVWRSLYEEEEIRDRMADDQFVALLRETGLHLVMPSCRLRQAYERSALDRALRSALSGELPLRDALRLADRQARKTTK